MSRSAYSATEKLAILNEFKSSQLPAKTFARQHGIDSSTLRQWQYRYARGGVEALNKTGKNKHYLATFKLAVVQAYLAGEGTQIEEYFCSKIFLMRQIVARLSHRNHHVPN